MGGITHAVIAIRNDGLVLAQVSPLVMPAFVACTDDFVCGFRKAIEKLLRKVASKLNATPNSWSSPVDW